MPGTMWIDSIPVMVLSGAKGLLGLCFIVASSYFGWILSRAMPSPSTRWFLRLVLLSIGLMVGLAVLELGLTGMSFAPGLTERIWLIVSALLLPIHLVERMAWIAAAGALLVFAAGKKRGCVGRRTRS